MKKILSFVLITMLALLPVTMVGCSSKSTEANTTYMPATTTTTATTTVAPVEPVDEYDALIMPEELAVRFGGAYMQKNGKLYSLNGRIAQPKAEKYKIGLAWGNTSREVCNVAARGDSMDKEDTDCVLTIGNVPIPEVSRKDKIKVWGTDKVYLEKAEFVGYSVPTWKRDFHRRIVKDTKTGELGDAFIKEDSSDKFYISKDFTILDVEQYQHLELWCEYYMSWSFNGKEDHAKVAANCKCYHTARRSNKTKPDYELNVAGDSTCDFSKIEPGIYVYTDNMFSATDRCLGIIEIK